MAGGFATGFGTGILGGMNQNFARQRQEQELGDRAQYEAFMSAAKEYDSNKQKLSDQGAKEDALANIISGGQPNAAAYAVARDAVELGYDKTEHLPYVMDAYQRTLKDSVENPEKWSGVKKQNSDPLAAVPTAPDDSNLNQTNVIRKFGNQTSLEDIENIRNRKFDRPHGDLPGANWMSPEDTNTRVATENSKATHMGALQAENSPEGMNLIRNKAKAGVEGQLGAYGYGVDESGQPVRADQGPTPAQVQQPVSSAMPGQAQGQAQAQSPMQVSEADLAPPGQQPPAQAPAAPQQMAANAPPPSPGIQLNAPAPPDTSQPQGTAGPMAQPQQQQAPAQPPAQAPAAAPIANSVPTVAPTQLGSAMDFGKLEQSGALHPEAIANLTPSDQAYVRSMVAGLRTPIPPYSGARNAHSQMLIEALNNYDPSYTDGRFAARNKFLHGQEATNLRNLNTAYNHMGLLAEAADKLDGSNLPALNAIANSMGVQTGKSAPVVFDNIKYYVSSEMRRFYTNGHGGLAELETISSNIDKNQSPEQIRGVMNTNLHLLDGAADSYDNQYREFMGNAYEPKSFLSKTAQNVRDSLLQKTDLSAVAGGAAAKAAMKNAPDFSHLWSQ